MTTMTAEPDGDAPLSSDELDAIRERAERATPGPWQASVVAQVHPSGRPAVASCHMQISEGGRSPLYDFKANAAFIAHAREDIPRLLADLDAARRALREIADCGRRMATACHARRSVQ